MLEQLKFWGLKKAAGLTLTEDEKRLAVMNVAALQHRGDIPDDEFNGIMAFDEIAPGCVNRTPWPF